jgi:aminocarboxymuconate-semialdehyde decarboxylase
MMIHPDYILGEGVRLNKYYTPIMIGAIFETTIAFTYLVLGQVMDKFPKLKIILCHGGGAVPYQIGRIEHGSEVREEAKGRADKKPSEYLRSFYYDTIVHTDAALEFLVKVVGADRIIFGTDYAMNMGEWDGLKRVQRINISDSDKAKISKTNAVALYHL